MYLAVYLFPVPSASMGRFLEIQEEESAIYREYGAISYETFRAADLSSKFGTSSIIYSVELRDGEELVLEFDCYRDKADHDRVALKVDNDERNTEIYREVCRLIDVGRVRRGEFAQSSGEKRGRESFSGTA